MYSYDINENDLVQWQAAQWSRLATNHPLFTPNSPVIRRWGKFRTFPGYFPDVFRIFSGHFPDIFKNVEKSGHFPDIIPGIFRILFRANSLSVRCKFVVSSLSVRHQLVANSMLFYSFINDIRSIKNRGTNCWQFTVDCSCLNQRLLCSQAW